MSEWKEYKLGEIAVFVKSKISTKEILINDYISTENMIEDKGGITLASKVPESGTITKYFRGNVLVSNIRPYFKKIWFANKSGGCSNDVLCFKGDDNLIKNEYLFFLLSQDEFFDYVMLGSKGCKMPRGDKSHIMSWDIILPSLPEQERIAVALSSLNDMIDLLKRQNETLESIAEALFRHYIIDEAKEEWKEKSLSQIAIFLNGLACQKFPPKSEKEKLPVLKIKELSNGITDNSDWATTEISPEYLVQNGDVIFAWSASLMVKIWNGGDCILNQHLFKVTSKQYPKWFYYMWSKFHLKEFKSIASSHATTMGHIKRGDLDAAMVLIPSKTELKEITKQIQPIIEKQILNNKKIITLAKLRDILLPKLMNGDFIIK